MRFDLGSGSGILSITAILLGAAHATGVDIDPKAEDIARENAAINQIFADRFTAVTGDIIGDKAMMESLKGHYDVVLANIVADVIIPLSRVVPEFLQEDSIFICSGILNTRLPEVLDALEKNGLQILSHRTAGGLRAASPPPCSRPDGRGHLCVFFPTATNGRCAAHF